MDSSPVIVISGQQILPVLGKDAFQEADVTGITYPVVKHSYLVKNGNDIPRIVREAFHVATTGRPGPVLIDLPKDIGQGPCAAPFTDQVDLPGYQVALRGDPQRIAEAARLLREARRPLLYVGHGAVLSDAGKAITALAEKLRAPLVTTLLGKGAVDETHPLHLGMMGMHGTAYANKAVVGCDLIMSIGGRWDDRITGRVSDFCRDAVKIHIDIDAAEFNKIIRPDVAIHGDARLVIEEMIPLVEMADTTEWLKQCNRWRRMHPLKYPKQGGLRAQHVLDRLDALTQGDAILTTDVGQHQMWAAQFCRSRSNRHWLTSGGAGTMGFGWPAAIGAQFGNPGKKVWAIVGDGGFQMTCSELATAQIHKQPVKCLIINNNFLGMIRQWQEMFYENRLSGSDLEGNPDFVKLAEAYGITAFKATTTDDVDRTIRAAQAVDGPALIWFEIAEEQNVFPMMPAGKGLSDLIETWGAPEE
jgi:acetolactate synthase-1/2/3 large subunit